MPPLLPSGRLAVLAVVLAGCSGLPPEPIAPLRAGEFVVGATLDVPLRHGEGSLSLWAGVGAGAGVDVAASVDAPFTVFQSFYSLASGAPLAPPGLAVRRTFGNGIGVGVGTASVIGVGNADGHPNQLTAGPFVTIGTTDADGLVARATGHLVYEARSLGSHPRAGVRHGLSVIGVASVGGGLAAGSGFVVPGARVVVGRGISGPAWPVAMGGVFVQSISNADPACECP